MDPAQFLPAAVDPNAPPKLDLDLARKLCNASRTYQRLPNGDVMVAMATQLKCALDRLQEGTSAVTSAQNDVTRYQREAENANREVQAMTAQLGSVREERDTLKDKVAALEKDIASLKAPPELPKIEALAPKKRGPKAKVVPIGNPQQKAAQ